MKRIAVVLVAVISLLTRPHRTEAQTGPASGRDVTVRAGLHLPMNALGPVAPAGPAWHLHLERMDVTPALEVAIRSFWPGRILGARVIAAWALPADASGFFNCNPGLACPAVLLPSDARVGSVSVVGDVVIAPRRSGRFQPWVAAGAGLRRYRYSWSDAVVLVGAGSHTESTLTVHGGVGLDLAMPFGSIQAEIADYWSPRGGVIARADGDLSNNSTVRRSAQHDIVVNIGWRVMRF